MVHRVRAELITLDAPFRPDHAWLFSVKDSTKRELDGYILEYLAADFDYGWVTSTRRF
jgi:hypothetical protein